MSQLRQGHRCQIDCTNHEEVINGLELKSKDLYFFWRNYQWLYARYEQSLLQGPPEPQRSPQVVKEIVTVKESHEKCHKEMQELENSNERLTRQNKKLRMELESFKRQLGEQEKSNSFEAEYKKKIATLENKNAELDAIIEKQLGEIGRLKKAVQAAQEETESQRLRLNKEINRVKQTVIQLQQTIDEQRSRPPPTTQIVSKVEGPSLQQIQEFKSKQTLIITSKVRALSEQAQQLIAQQCEAMRREFQQRFQQALQSLGQRELQAIIQVVEQ